MSVRARNLLIILIALVAAAAGVYWFLATYHQVPFEFRTPPGAAARRNRLLALEQTLRAREHTVFNTLRFHGNDLSDPKDSAVILDIDPRNLREAEVDRLLEFVSDGAVVLLRMPASAEGRAGKLLDELGVEPLAAEAPCFDIDLAEKRSYRMCGGTRLGGDIETRYSKLASYDDEDYGYWFGHTRRAAGSVYLVSELDMLHNDKLDNVDAVALAEVLLAPVLERKRIHLFRGIDGEPFHVLLLRHGAPFFVPALIALLLWLWLRSQRFGPLLPDLLPHRRALLEHVRASGEFLFRRGQPVAMHRAVLARVQKRIDEREPSIAALPIPERDAALAKRTGLDALAIRHALNPVGLGRPENFFATLSTLLQLERRL